mmetsp:Transcript_24608/g.38220  ORF Transcript_24608/g.38220 Transcript_24608/m.38220 type:complete len:128 (+) Transcript_24608:3016-3399(+)
MLAIRDGLIQKGVQFKWPGLFAPQLFNPTTLRLKGEDLFSDATMSLLNAPISAWIGMEKADLEDVALKHLVEARGSFVSPRHGTAYGGGFGSQAPWSVSGGRGMTDIVIVDLDQGKIDSVDKYWMAF